MDYVQGLGGICSVTLVEYGDFESSGTLRLRPVIKEVQLRLGDDLCLVYRNLTGSATAREAAETLLAAGAQGAFWPMFELLSLHPSGLDRHALLRYASQLELDLGRLAYELDTGRWLNDLAEQVKSAWASGITSPPGLVINGAAYGGPFELHSLLAALRKVQTGIEMTHRMTHTGHDGVAVTE